MGFGKAAALFVMVSYATAASCPSQVKALDSLDLKKYPGRWYEVASENLDFLSGCSCSCYDYKMTGKQTFDDRFTCTKGGKPADIDLVLKGKILNLTNPAVQEESPYFSWLPSAPYLVLETDYNYAVVYACVPLVLGEIVETTYIFHRDPQALSKKLIDLDAIKGRLSPLGIAVDKIKPVDHPQNCTYPTSHQVV